MKTLGSYKGSTKALAAAVIQAKKLALTMEDTQNISDNLLDIESSLKAEMQASVLTGKHINMNTARQLALQGDTAGAAAEALKQVGGYDELMKMAPYKQKALAEAAGMTTEQLIKSTREQKRQQMFGEKTLAQMTAADKKRLVDQKIYTKEQLESLEKEQQSATLKEKMVQLGDKLMKAFDAIATGPLGTLVDGLSSAVGFLSTAFTKAKEFLGKILPEGSGSLLKGVAGISMGIMALRGGIQKVKGFFGKSAEEKQTDLLQEIAQNTKSMGGGGGGGGMDDMGSDGSDGKNKKGRRGRKKAGFLKRTRDAYKKGGLKGVGKSMAQSFKKAGGIKGVGKSMVKSAGKGLASVGRYALGMSPAAASSGGSTPKTSSRAPKGSAPKAGAGPKKVSAPKIKSGLLGKVSDALGKAGGIMKFAGPLMSIFSGVSSAMDIISDAKSRKAAGEEVKTSEVGKNLVKSAAYPLASGLINFIPGIGSIISVADGLLGMFGMSPIKMITDKIVDILPDDWFDGIGKFAIGEDKAKAATPAGPGAAPVAVKDALIRPGQPPVTFDKGDIIMAGTNLLGDSGAKPNAESGGSELVGLMKQLIAKVDQPINLTIGNKAIREISTQSSIARSISTKADRSYGTFA